MNPDWTDYWDHCEEECCECKKKEKRFATALDYFEGIVEMLSKNEPYDSATMESYIEEVAHALGQNSIMQKVNIQGLR